MLLQIQNPAAERRKVSGPFFSGRFPKRVLTLSALLGARFSTGGSRWFVWNQPGQLFRSRMSVIDGTFLETDNIMGNVRFGFTNFIRNENQSSAWT